MTSAEWEERERDFWDHHIPNLREAMQSYRAGIDLFAQTLLARLEPLDGRRVLDFACGAGVLSALLAARGADVVGVDISPLSIDRAKELTNELGLSAEFRVVELDQAPVGPGEQFDVVTGRFALHHLDLSRYLPLLSDALRPGGTAAFVETMATNPMLRFARRFVVGHLGIPRLGTADEHPLTRADLEAMERHIGPVQIVVPEVDFLKLISRQGIRNRPAVDRMCSGADRWLSRRPALHFLSYHQLILSTKVDSAPAAH